MVADGMKSLSEIAGGTCFKCKGEKNRPGIFCAQCRIETESDAVQCQEEGTTHERAHVPSVEDEAYRCIREGLFTFDCIRRELHIIHTENGYDLARPCDCGRMDPAELRIQKLKKRLGDKTFDTYHAPVGLEVASLEARLVAENGFKIGAYMVGPTGAGKTHLAKAILFEAVKAGKAVEYIEAPHLAYQMGKSQGFGDGHEEAMEFLRRLEKVQVLVIDDLGSQRARQSHVFEEQFQLFLDHFSGCLVITTNLLPRNTENAGVGDMIGSIGRKCQSRIAEKCVVISFAGHPDHRIGWAKLEKAG
jgi:DNA replication protein DnaC